MDRNFFTGVKIEEIKLSTGVRIGLPVRYYDWSVIMAHFPVPAARVRELLPSDRLKPALLLSEDYAAIVAGLHALGCTNLVAEVWDASPLVPEPLKPPGG
jgi:hypothetical protein